MGSITEELAHYERYKEACKAEGVPPDSYEAFQAEVERLASRPVASDDDYNDYVRRRAVEGDMPMSRAEFDRLHGSPPEEVVEAVQPDPPVPEEMPPGAFAPVDRPYVDDNPAPVATDVESLPFLYAELGSLMKRIIRAEVEASR